MVVEQESRSVEIDGRPIPYVLRVSARARHMRADIHLREGLRVTVPRYADEAAIAPFLQAHARWITRTLARFERLAQQIPERSLDHGGRVPFLGQELTLDLNVGTPARVGRLGDTLVVHVPRRVTGVVRTALSAWYRREAERHFRDRTRLIAGRHGVAIDGIRVRDMRTLWGSCSPRGALSFNWRLMLAPPEVVDYLITHELSHRSQRNHSPSFWRRVAELCPEWRERERWLRKNGRSLVL